LDATQPPSVPAAFENGAGAFFSIAWSAIFVGSLD